VLLLADGIRCWRRGVVAGGWDPPLAERGLEVSDVTSARLRFFDLSVDAFCIGNADGFFMDVNAAWGRVLGWSAAELCARPFIDFVHPDDVALKVAETTRLNDGQATVSYRNRCRCKDGTYVWLSWTATAEPASEDADAESLIYAVARDVTDRVRMDEKLTRLADSEPLTGLWNRRRFDEELAKQIVRCRRYDETATLLMLDLDHLKQVNDTRGHKVGDDLIKHVGTKLARRVRSSDAVARVGGDEFAILLPHLSPDEAAHAAELLASHLAQQPFMFDGESVPISVSIGMAFLDKTTSNEDDAMVSADIAMYDAKAAGRDRRSGLRRSSVSTGPAIRVVHCEDSESYRRLLAEMLTAHEDIDIVGVAADEGTALRAVGQTKPDVILLDVLSDLTESDASGFVEQLHQRSPGAQVLVLSGRDACPPALATCTDGFISKRGTFDDIADAVRTAWGDSQPAT
jgi:diguanylate cyclase (GGDEF)-like protein/PAS domain S-box-containing protein